MFILNKTYLETAQTTLAWSLPSVSRTCHLWLLVWLPPSMTFHPQPEVMQPFLVSSDTNFFYHPSTYSNSLKALVSWPNGFSYISSNCLLIYVVYGVILTFFDDLKTFLTQLAIACNVLYQTQLNSASSSWSCLICCFCFSFIPTYCVSTLTFRKGGAMSQSANTADADADADEDVDVVLDSLCFLCPPTIVIKQCKLNLIVGVLILKKDKELCSLSLVDTAISDQCANGLPWFETTTWCHFSSSNFWCTEEFNMHIIWVI